MLNQLMKIFNMPKSDNPVLDKDAVADLLRVSPGALAAFEEAYKVNALNHEPDDFFVRIPELRAFVPKDYWLLKNIESKLDALGVK